MKNNDMLSSILTDLKEFAEMMQEYEQLMERHQAVIDEMLSSASKRDIGNVGELATQFNANSIELDILNYDIAKKFASFYRRHDFESI